MMGFDDGRFSAKSAFHNVRVNRSLYKEIDCPDLLCFFFKYTDKFFSDDFSLLFRLFHACQLAVETLLRIHTDEVQIVIAVGTEDCFYLIAFILTEQAVIYEDTGQLLADCLG